MCDVAVDVLANAGAHQVDQGAKVVERLLVLEASEAYYHSLHGTRVHRPDGVGELLAGGGRGGT